MGDARGEHWQEDLRACGCEEANRLGIAANREWRIANGESRIGVKATNPSCVQPPPRVCNTGCVNKGLWATLDLPCHFAARIDKEGGGWLQVGGPGESRIANVS